MRLISVVGARPSFVKMAPLLPELAKAGISVDIAYTGNRRNPRPAVHPPASMTFYGVDVPAPRWFLDVGSGAGELEPPKATAALGALFCEQRPDAVLLVGDGDSALAAAVSAARSRIPVIHLEAGLRCHDLSVPEEVNRILISRIASMHLTPTEDALENLEGEGVDPDRIYFVGSVLAQAVLDHLESIGRRKPCTVYGVKPQRYVLGSFHGADTLGSAWRLAGVVQGLGKGALPAIVPDPGPLRAAIDEHGIDVPPSVQFVDPVSYPDMLALERDAAVIVTDSSGVQEEACIIRTPCVTVRDSTERYVTIKYGCNRLASTTGESIAEAISASIGCDEAWPVPKRWDRAVSDRIARAILRGVEPVQ